MKRLCFAALLVCFLCLLVGCSKSDCGPPEELLYLGGAPILNEFSTSGGSSEASGAQSDIIIFVPLNLVEDGFSASILGTAEDGAQINLLHGASLSPGEYYAISKDTYSNYDELSLHITYMWNGKMMSMRVIDLFSHKDLVPAYPSE